HRALVERREHAVELLRDDQVEHGVAQELEALVVLAGARRGVRQGEGEQALVAELVGEGHGREEAPESAQDPGGWSHRTDCIGATPTPSCPPMTPETAKNVIEARALVRRFGERVAVDGLDFELASGECLGLLGPNGAGKSTTVRILATLLSPTSGSVRVLGLDPVTEGERL